jgi:SAM-dependent methyltransferase
MKKEIESYYHDKLSEFGTGAQGVGWKNETVQYKRFEQLCQVIADDTKFSINDLGCGTGELLLYLRKQAYSDFTYYGYDVLENMIGLASERFRDTAGATFKHLAPGENPATCDYTVASGIFNLKYDETENSWIKYITTTLATMNQVSTRGFSFNMLTSYSDKHLMEPHLFYGDPLFFFDHCKKNYAKNVALLHDYNEYDFTILVRK